MSAQVPNSFQTKFYNSVDLLLQKTQCQLENAVTTQDDASSEKVKVQNFVGNVMPQRADERHGDIKINNRAYDGVWIPKTAEYYDADMIDNADQLSTAVDLQGSVTMSAMATINRAKDMAVLEGFYGPIISGKEGTTVTAFPGANIVPVTEGGAAGAQKINVAKLIAADTLLAQNYVDADLEKWMVLTANDNAQLLTEVPATSSEFKAAYSGEFVNGKIKSLLGWNFIHMELDNPMLGSIPSLATDGSGYRKTPFWVKPGIRVNYWQRLRTLITVEGLKLGSRLCQYGTTLTATRTQAGMCGIILNAKG